MKSSLTSCLLKTDSLLLAARGSFLDAELFLRRDLSSPPPKKIFGTPRFSENMGEFYLKIKHFVSVLGVVPPNPVCFVFIPICFLNQHSSFVLFNCVILLSYIILIPLHFVQICPEFNKTSGFPLQEMKKLDYLAKISNFHPFFKIRSFIVVFKIFILLVFI